MGPLVREVGRFGRRPPATGRPAGDLSEVCRRSVWEMRRFRRTPNDAKRRETTENGGEGETAPRGAEKSRADRAETREMKEMAEREGNEEETGRNGIDADPQPIPAQRIECGFGSSCSRVRRARAFSSTDAWKQTAQTGAAYSTTAVEGSEKCAASRRAKISPGPRPSPNARGRSGRGGYPIPGGDCANLHPRGSQGKYLNNLLYLPW